MITDRELRRFTADQAQDLLEPLVALYREIHATPETEFHNEARYRRQIAGHMSVPGWTLVTAIKRDELVGYAYGFPLPENTGWWQGLQTTVPNGFTVEDGRRTFAISEIMVRAAYRRQGIARALHDELLAGQPAERATLLAEPGNLPAQAAYAGWGWRKIGQLRPGWENAPLFDVLVR
ncbi:N-acetyltransferase family protein [Micromonospora sp. NPDC003197]